MFIWLGVELCLLLAVAVSVKGQNFIWCHFFLSLTVFVFSLTFIKLGLRLIVLPFVIACTRALLMCW